MRTTGRYELEMHGIAADQGRAAAFLLSSVAELVFEVGLPPPGEPFEIASGVFVRFMPWEQAAAAAPPECFGSTAHREDHAGRAPPPGARAAVCAMDSLSWPADAAGCLLRGEAVLFKTTQATERDGRIARHTLDHFARMFQSVPPARRKDAPDRVAAFMIKAGFAVPGHADAQGSGDREHLWFEATEVKNGRVRGTLLNDPMHVHLRRGDETWIDRNVISDWQVLTSRGQFGPLQHAAAAQTIAQALAGGPHG
jgi:uncharacterized protein YegJ (DUF2314 family)